MCFDEKTSWVTFIVGTIINVSSIGILLKSNTKKILVPICLILLWQYALFMQIADALAWKYPKSSIPPKLACFLNTTQPLIAFLLVVYIITKKGVSSLTIYPAIIALVIYGIFISRDIQNSSLKTIKPWGLCNNLNYDWWSRISFIFYCAAILLSVWAIPYKITGIGLLILTTIIFIGSFILALFLTGSKCASGSLWCWMVASAGLITFIYTYINKH